MTTTETDDGLRALRDGVEAVYRMYAEAEDEMLDAVDAFAADGERMGWLLDALRDDHDEESHRLAEGLRSLAARSAILRAFGEAVRKGAEGDDS